jgi:hypothetical protein
MKTRKTTRAFFIAQTSCTIKLNYIVKVLPVLLLFAN